MSSDRYLPTPVLFIALVRGIYPPQSHLEHSQGLHTHPSLSKSPRKEYLPTRVGKYSLWGLLMRLGGYAPFASIYPPQSHLEPSQGVFTHPSLV